jgi:hypothetical protein
MIFKTNKHHLPANMVEQYYRAIIYHAKLFDTSLILAFPQYLSLSIMVDQHCALVPSCIFLQ